MTTTAASLVGATPAGAAVPTVQQEPAGTVTADALPTVQINGVAWAQVVVGNRVIVGGSFTSARPAGAPLGTSETPRGNMLAYDLTTGVLDPTFAPTFNNQVTSLVVSPDGQTLYVGGQFTNVNSRGRQRVAAIDAVTGALRTTFTTGPNYTVNSMALTPGALYLGGQFTSVNGQTRTRLAAVDPTTGALLPWAPAVNGKVSTMVLTPRADRLVVGGMFSTVNGQAMRGMTALDLASGVALPWAANTTVLDGGTQSGITSLRTDGTYVYGTGYSFANTGNFEGTFQADPDTGTIVWLEDCHGDTYDSYPTAAAVYVVSHSHYCTTVGGFPQTNSDRAKSDRYFAEAFTPSVQGTLGHNEWQFYKDWYGMPAPAMINWFPLFKPGTATGQDQAGWTLTGNGTYVVVGGEFPSVNGTAQQGLVRFAPRGVAPAKMGPRVANAAWVQTLAVTAPGTVTVSFPANWDLDDANLTYTIVRNSTTKVIATFTAASTFWNRPTLTYVDPGAVRGISNGYRVYVTDGDGNKVATNTQYVTVPA